MIRLFSRSLSSSLFKVSVHKMTSRSIYPCLHISFPCLFSRSLFKVSFHEMTSWRVIPHCQTAPTRLPFTFFFVWRVNPHCQTAPMRLPFTHLFLISLFPSLIPLSTSAKKQSQSYIRSTGLHMSHYICDVAQCYGVAYESLHM